MQPALYGKIKERRETEGEWLIGENIQNIPYLSIVVADYKIRQKCVMHLLMKFNARRRAVA